MLAYAGLGQNRLQDRSHIFCLKTIGQNRLVELAGGGPANNGAILSSFQDSTL